MKKVIGIALLALVLPLGLACGSSATEGSDGVDNGNQSSDSNTNQNSDSDDNGDDNGESDNSNQNNQNNQSPENDSNDRDSEMTPEDEFVEFYGDHLSNHQQYWRYICRCHWSDDDYWPEWSDTDYFSEQHCLDDRDAERDDETIKFCLDQVIEDVGPFDGEQSKIAGLLDCYETTTNEYENCLESVPETCSSYNTEQIEECFEEGDEQFGACWVLEGNDEVDAWLDEVIMEAGPRCGL